VVTTAAYTPPITVCLAYDDTGMSAGREQALKIFHWEDNWVDVTSSRDTTNNIICGVVNSLSWFGTAVDITPVIGTINAPIDPIAVGTSITVDALFSDPTAMASHTATWHWGDGTTSSGTITESSPWISGSVAGSHAYLSAGVYTITLTVENADGGMGSAEYSYVVIYDPNAGFVTGGGWIWSPLNTTYQYMTEEGKATFGFVSKYQKGAKIPTGETEFQFKTTNLNFHSGSYEWLVVSGARAQYKGAGTINGAGDYGFLLTAIDGQISGGGGVDKFRIKIWEKATDTIVYDNQPGADDTSNSATTISGGSIVIHAKK
jgi:hypothetical protein